MIQTNTVRLRRYFLDGMTKDDLASALAFVYLELYCEGGWMGCAPNVIDHGNEWTSETLPNIAAALETWEHIAKIREDPEVLNYVPTPQPS